MNGFRVLILFSLLFLSACLSNQAPAPFANYGGGAGGGSAGIHTVSAGETLWTISKRYRMEMRDIATLNRLAAPFELPPGTRLMLPPPREYRAREGDTLSEVARLFNASQTDIARLNNLSAPYVLTKGQVLRMPSPRPLPEEFFADTSLASAPVEPVAQQPVAAYQPPPSYPVEAYGAPQPIAREELAPPQSQPQEQKIAAAPVPLEIQSMQAPPQAVSYQPPPKPAQIKAVKEKITAETPKRASSKFLRPLNGRVLSSYGPTKDGLHNDGINIAAPRGTPVRAAENGVVVYAGNELKGSGNLVLIRHEGRWMTAYAHMDHFAIKRGDIVKRGQQIGTVGNTGSVAEPQLHFEVRRGTEAINPERFIEG